MDTLWFLTPLHLDPKSTKDKCSLCYYCNRCSDTPLFRHLLFLRPVIRTPRYSDTPLLRLAAIRPKRYSCNPQFRHPVIPTTRYLCKWEPPAGELFSEPVWRQAYHHYVVTPDWPPGRTDRNLKRKKDRSAAVSHFHQHYSVFIKYTIMY